MGQIELTVALVFIGLFSIAIIGFAVNFASDNNTSINLADDPEMNLMKNQINSNLSSFREESENTYQSLIKSSIQESDITTTGGQFSLTPLTALAIVKNIVKVGYIKIFGTGSGFGIFLTAFISVLSFIFALYLWKTWGGRNPN